jgi:hypothetical protein
MGLKLPDEQIAPELGLSVGNVRAMTTKLREGNVLKKPIHLRCNIETDYVYMLPSGY